MDDTHLSRVSDAAAAAATRKRRSSILKSQRPPRTPFSELEFNVATPTDAAKSRRVSFSRRTGVAEFITNEATTTWKNFYEEHNKSLESSGNESGANAPRPIGHIGKRIFDQQFQEVEAVDFGSTLDSHSNRNINTSINNVNFTQQLASLECTGDDRKLSVPQQNFEMSAFTEHQSKLFGDDLAITAMGGMSGRIDVNFSAVQTIGEVKDDLDEIQNDLQRAQSNIVCPGPFTGRRSMSGYIEVDLNSTHVTVANDDNDMSITDTIQSPKVQDVSKNHSSNQIDKKASFSKDWLADKENIALNPYVTPKESTNFAINDETDKILVFDGKRLTVQSDKDAEKILKGCTDDPKQSLPKETKAYQRKTIVLNTNDDLPNFIENPHMSTSNGILSSTSFKHSVMYDVDDELTNENKFLEIQQTIHGNDTGNISTTEAISSNIILSENFSKCLESSKTVVFGNIDADISMTQALPSKIIDPQETQRRRTILYENETGDISITQAIPANILVNESKRLDNEIPERRRTILFNNEMGNISITQAISANILTNESKESKPEPERRRTILYEHEMGNLSITQAIPANILTNESNKPQPERRRTIIYDNDMGNVSMTQTISANILINESKEIKPEPERRRTILYEHEMGNLSITQAIPANILTNESNKPQPERRRTIIYDNDMGNVSMTQTIPANILTIQSQESNKPEPERRITILYDHEMGNISVTQAIPANILTNESKKAEPEVLYDNEMDDKSITQAIPANILTNESKKAEPEVLYDNEMGDISFTQAIPANILTNESNNPETVRRRTILYDNEVDNMSMTQAIPANIINENKEGNKPELEKRKTILFDDDNISNNVSMTQSKPAKIFINEGKEGNKPEVERRRTIHFDDDTSNNISITQAIPASIICNVMTEDNKVEPGRRRTILYDNDMGNISITQAIPPNILVNENRNVDKSKTVLYDNIEADVSMTQGMPVVYNVFIDSNNLNSEAVQRKTITFESEESNISVNRPLPCKIQILEEKSEPESNTMHKDDSLGNISITQAIPANILCNEKSKIEDDNPAKEILPAEDDLGDRINIVDSQADLGDISITRALPTNIILPKDNRETIVSTDRIKLNKCDVSKKNNEDEVNIEVPESLEYIEEVDAGVSADLPNKLEEKNNEDDVNIIVVPESHLLEYKEEVDVEVSADLPKKLDELKSLVNEKSPFMNRHYEKIVSSDLDKSESHDLLEMSKGGKSFKDANDTNELLEMLSDLTDRRHSKAPEKPVENIETNEPRRLSVAPNRLSIVFSREDLLNNISMAQAALQRSMEIDESIDDTTSDTPVEVSLPSKKAARVSNEVVKKLHFEEDESVSDTSIKSDMKGSPLKKTAFGETSYMKESKAKVIPSYLKDVSDEIKALMSDLVKPNVDSVTIPVPSTDKCLKRDPSTCSTQIQANLITSSQIDLETELTSVTNSACELEKASMPSGSSIDSRGYGLTSFRKSLDVELTQEISFRPKRDTPKSPSQDRVIVFDHHNPLNNILLVPMDFSDVHTYNPHKSNETLCEDIQSVHSIKEIDILEKTNTQIVGSVTVSHSMQPSGDSVPDKSDAQSLLSNQSKPNSIDESVSARVCELKDTKVNTLIAMKVNKELLEASSSLTLVDDALAHNAFDVDLDMVTAESSTTNNVPQKSPVEVIYHNDDQDVVLSERVDSEFTSTDDMVEPIKMSTKGKKRIYSPTKKDKHKYSALSSLDVTPKPITKMQKMSNSPKYKVPITKAEPEKLTAEKDENARSKSAMDIEESSDGKTSPQERKRSPRKAKSPKSRKPGTSVTVQQLLTEYDIYPDIDQNALNKQIIEALSRSDSSTAPNTASLTDVQSKSPDIVSSFTSSKNQNEMREACSVSTTESRTMSSRSKSAKLDWHPEVAADTSLNTVSECESSVNVVAKIDMLPFMGSHECEWEAAGIDTWSFRLLHGRLRLNIRLAHRHDNATRTRVRADTPVQHVALDTAHADKKNSVATLCVGFALEAMRYFVGRGCRTAGDVPALLRRCAGVARVALRWGRAMHEARLHLAYTLDNDGCLALKVANIPLRSVWEVTMRLELVVEDAREVPWPRACDVVVSRVVSDVRVPSHEVRRALAHLPRDWGHAPRTVWKIFRYLKNKTREDDLLGL